MRLVGKLKEKVSKTETKEQAKELIANAGMELTDEEMNKVAGGQSWSISKYKVIDGVNQNSKQDQCARVVCNAPVKMGEVKMGEDGIVRPDNQD